MTGINYFILKIRRREGKIADYIYKMVMWLRNIEIPYWKPLYLCLFYSQKAISSTWRYILAKLYYEPLFKSLCYKVGKRLRLVGGLPYVHNNLKIILGDNVVMYGFNTSFGGGKIMKDPILEIGDNTFIGPGVKIGVCKEISIGNHCLIAARVIMSDNDGHSLDWGKRRDNAPLDPEDIRPITIEDDAWVGEGSFICKGVKIGRGAIVGARSVVTKDVPEFTVVAGNPARVIKDLEKDNHESIASR